MKFRPLHDRVVVRRIEGEDKTKGGIIIPDTVKEKSQEGEVIAVGPGARDESGRLVPLELKAGDRYCSANGPARRSRSTARTF
jgi:chaperonin GroES